jgi:hypothetical protein
MRIDRNEIDTIFNRNATKHTTQEGALSAARQLNVKDKPVLRGVERRIYDALVKAGRALSCGEVAKSLNRPVSTYLRNRIYMMVNKNIIGYVCVPYRETGKVTMSYKFFVGTAGQ